MYRFTFIQIISLTIRHNNHCSDSSHEKSALSISINYVNNNSYSNQHIHTHSSTIAQQCQTHTIIMLSNQQLMLLVNRTTQNHSLTHLYNLHATNSLYLKEAIFNINQFCLSHNGKIQQFKSNSAKNIS